MADTGNLTYLPTSNLDLTVHSSGDSSPIEDFFVFWFKIDPNIGTSARLAVFLYSGDDNRNYATFEMRTENKQPPASTLGVASLLQVKNAQGDLVSQADFRGEADKNDILAELAEKTWVQQTNEVQFAAIPKKLFRTTDDFDFSDVHRMAFIFHNIVDGAQICVGDILIVGGGKNESGAGAAEATRGGVQGTYRYRVTFLNTTTGNRSNPGTVTQVAKDVNRGYVRLTNIPTSGDAQVDAREIWRTMGDGTRFFKIATIEDNSTTTFDDQVADYAGLDSAPGVTVMTTEELPLDNDVPFADHDQHVILKMTAFWISSDSLKAGRLYYSPIGRPESQKGYIDVSSTEALRRMVVYQGILYVFSESKLYRIQGTDPYFAYEISGVPGVTSHSRRTVVATPFGIVWCAQDGIRIFNGSISKLLNFDPIGRVFRGETAEIISPFEGTVAEYARGEYLVSNGSQMLACEIESGAWRHVGFENVTSLYYEIDDDVLQGGLASNTQLLEEEGVFTDAGSDFDIHWETPAAAFKEDGIPFIERLIIDIDTGGETLTPNIVSRYDTQAYTTFSTSTRESFEIDVQELLLEPGVRLTGTIGAQVNLYDLQFEYRMLAMGINIEDNGARVTVPGRWREDLGTAGRIVFEVDPEIKEFDQTDKLYIIDRITVEADTEATTVTPRLVVANSTITLSALSTSTSRVVNTYDINRVGPINEFSLDGPFFTSNTRPKIYRVEIHVRELKLGLNVSTTNQRAEAMGRAPAPGTALLFEVQPIQQMFNELGNLYWIERIVIESNTGGTNVTPSIKIGGGTITLTAVNTSAREYTEISIERIGPLEHIQLAADFSTNIQLFGVEIYLRPVSLGIRMPDGRREEIGGKATDNSSAVVFDIDPADRRFDAQSFVPLVERLWIDVDSVSTEITPSIVMENQTIPLTPEATATRDTIMYNINHIGRIRHIELAADYLNNAIKLYGVEIQMRQLPLGISIITND